MKEKQYFVYVLMNKWNTTSYIGITSNLQKRIWEHKNKVVKGFTEKYKLNKLVYYEVLDSAYEAISREKQLKKWSRKKKIGLIKKMNLKFEDLFNKIV